jgi:hypothetical protein
MITELNKGPGPCPEWAGRAIENKKDILNEAHLEFIHVLRNLFISHAIQKSPQNMGGEGKTDWEIIFLKLLASETAYNPAQHGAVLHPAETVFL